MEERTCCFTGHREIPQSHLPALQKKLEETIRELVSQGFTRFEAGGALGFDTLAACTVLGLKEEFPHVRLVLALPCPQQANSWQPKDAALYENILNRSDYYFYVSQSYHRGCMQQRNRRLVDDSELCVAYCTQATGGTAYTVQYAEKKGVKVRNLADAL